jgi:hypothetical protein
LYINLKKKQLADMDAVEGYILDRESPQQEIMFRLHEMLLEYPGMHTRIRYRIPFYDRNSWICYLSPKKAGRVELAFIYGNRLSNEQGLLEAHGRKQVAGISFSSVREIEEQKVREVILEAILLDEAMGKGEKRRSGVAKWL